MAEHQLPTLGVELNHLECMGILMALNREKDQDGLSEPQVDAYEKVEAALHLHFKNMGMFKRGPQSGH